MGTLLKGSIKISLFARKRAYLIIVKICWLKRQKKETNIFYMHIIKKYQKRHPNLTQHLNLFRLNSGTITDSFDKPTSRQQWWRTTTIYRITSTLRGCTQYGTNSTTTTRSYGRTNCCMSCLSTTDFHSWKRRSACCKMLELPWSNCKF